MAAAFDRTDYEAKQAIAAALREAQEHVAQAQPKATPPSPRIAVIQRAVPPTDEAEWVWLDAVGVWLRLEGDLVIVVRP